MLKCARCAQKEFVLNIIPFVHTYWFFLAHLGQGVCTLTMSTLLDTNTHKMHQVCSLFLYRDKSVHRQLKSVQYLCLIIVDVHTLYIIECL